MQTKQATEPIVRKSLELKRPFAVVPCCVFKDESPHRRLADGTSVGSLPQFCQYLIELGTTSGVTVNVAYLPFEGRNKVLFVRNYEPDDGDTLAASLDLPEVKCSE